MQTTMAKNAKTIIPAVATHPGTVLKKELDARGIKQKEFAATVGMPAPNLNELIKGKRNITEAIAIKLQGALGIPYQNWMNLQNRYHYVMKCREDIDHTAAAAMAEELTLGSRLNLPALYRYYDISSSSIVKRLSRLKSLLSLDLNNLQFLEANTVGFFKRSERLKVDEINMRTWLLIAWSEAIKAKLTEEYHLENAQRAAIQIAEKANSTDISASVLKEILNSCGIVYIQVPKLEAAPIDAYSMSTGERPAIVVTYRHNDLDKLVFDILHELGHILLHISSGKSYIAVEHDYSTQSKEEREADEFANNTLIPPEIWRAVMSAKPSNLSPHAVVHTIAKEAERNGISASIAVARYKHDTRFYNIRSYRSPKIVG